MARETVLIVEDDNALRGLYRFALSMAGFSLGHREREVAGAGEDGPRVMEAELNNDGRPNATGRTSMKRTLALAALSVPVRPAFEDTCPNKFYGRVRKRLC